MTNEIKQDNELIEPWYKQGWPWALIAIPFLTVIAGVTTYQIAVNNPHQMVEDNYYKKGLAINSDLDLIDHAKKLGLSGELSYQLDSKLITFKLKFNKKIASFKDLNSKLIIKFSHPTLTALDKSFLLEPLEQSSNLKNTQNITSIKKYITSFDHIENAYWYITVTNEERTWQIKSRWLLPDTKQIEISPSR